MNEKPIKHDIVDLQTKTVSVFFPLHNAAGKMNYSTGTTFGGLKNAVLTYDDFVYVLFDNLNLGHMNVLCVFLEEFYMQLWRRLS
jgi:hypothetical protein